ncbi:MAG: hypothetical protein GY805_15630 [Chloroflexi bacterium]|nr:hypothetical protein [Chloroflexota bacterium]
MWQIATYHSTALFSLRPYNATTSGGKTLITPTPFAFKMALLDAAIRVYGLENGKAWFPRLRDLKVAIRLPAHLIVNNTFIKILRPFKGGKPRDVFGTGLAGPMGNTIAYRELVHFGGPLEIAAFDASEKGQAPPVKSLLTQLHYLGKRGGFIQLQDFKQSELLPDSFTLLNPEPNRPFQVHGLLQMMDDCGPKMSFEHADVYQGKNTLSLNKPNGRVVQPVVLPYRPTRSSRAFTLYERIT